jgi:hypothetical protein
MEQVADRLRRPLLIWLTQILVFLFASLFALFLISTLVALPQLVDTYLSALCAIVASVAIHSLIVAGLVSLLVGLVRRRRWAWTCSIAFAACLPVLVIASRLHPSGPIPILPVPPKQLLGAAAGDLVPMVLLVAYPLALFFSRKVRRFFDVPDAAKHVP